MRKTSLLLAALLLGVSSSLPSQRRMRLGPTGSSIAIENASGVPHGFTSYGASIALITGDDNETGFTIARYPDLSDSSCTRTLMSYSLDSYYYPVGARGVAPFASTALGLARVAESMLQTPILGSCGTVSTTSEISLGFGLGVRLGAGPDIVALIAGRFFEVPNSGIQSLEARANLSLALGSPRTGEFQAGTVGPAVAALVPVSGRLRARGPLVGVRFRRDTRKASSVVGLEIDYAPLKVTGTCSPPGCAPNAILFAPGYEASLSPPWGRLYAEAGLLVAGFYSQGPDRGVAQGAHAGLGADVASSHLLWNVNCRVLWLTRNDGANVFGVQAGVALSPALRRAH